MRFGWRRTRFSVFLLQKVFESYRMLTATLDDSMTIDTDNRLIAEKRLSFASLILALTFSLLSFAVHCTIESRLDKLGVFDQNDVLFDADPEVRLDALAHGWGGRSWIHPNLANFFNPPIRVLGILSQHGHIVTHTQKEVRRTLGLFILPLASSLQTFVMFWVFSFLDLSLFQVSLLTILNLFSFSQLIFGSIPDHFGLTGLIISICLLLAIDLIRRNGKMRWWAWISVSVVAVGITITNGITVGLLLWITLAFVLKKIAKPTLITAAVLGVSGIINVSTGLVLNQMYYGGQNFEDSLDHVRYVVTEYTHQDVGNGFLRFPAAVIDTLSPRAIKVKDYEVGIKDGLRYRIQFSLEDAPAVNYRPQQFLRLVVFLLFGIGAFCFVWADMPMRCLGVAAIMVLAYNWVLHGFWGTEMILYSQHWQAVTVLLIAGVLLSRSRRLPAVTLLLGLIVTTLIINNLVQLHKMETILLSSDSLAAETQSVAAPTPFKE